MTENLRMQAVVVDGFSGPLKQFNSLLSQVAVNPAAKQVTKEWQGVSLQFQRATTEIRTGLMPAMSMLGATMGLGLGAGLAGLAQGFKVFATGTRDIGMFSRGVGLSINEVKQFSAVAGHFGISANEVKSAITHLNDQVRDFKKNFSATYETLHRMNMGKLAEKMAKAPNMKAFLDAAIQGIKEANSPDIQRKLARMFFGTEAMATLAREMTPEIRKMVEGWAGTITQETAKASEAFALNMTKMELSLEHLKVQGFGPALVELNAFLDKLSAKDIVDGFSGALNQLNGFVGTTVREFKAVLEFFGKVDEYLNRGNAKQFADRPGETDGERLARMQTRKSQIEQEKRSGRLSDTPLALRHEEQQLAGEIKRLREALERGGGATVQPQGFQGSGSGPGGLFHKAGFGAFPSLGGAGPFGGGSAFGGGPGGGSMPSFGGGASPGGGGPQGSAGPPSGSTAAGAMTRGKGDWRGMMRIAMDQLRKEGVPEDRARAAAALLVGNAYAESKFNPRSVHDGGTGYGIYGARLERRTRMLAWLKANGYAPDSAEGQMRYMAREAMTDRSYRRTRQTLMNADPAQVGRQTSEVMNDFERPANRYQDRSGDARRAYREGGLEGSGRPEAAERQGSQVAPPARNLNESVAARMVEGFRGFASGGYYGAPRRGGRLHGGLDAMGKLWGQVFARQAGTVTDAQPYKNNFGGASVRIQYDDGTNSRSIHISPSVEAGQRLEAGQPYGRMVPRGHLGSTGPHLHYEMYDKNGRRLDPRSTLAARYGEAGPTPSTVPFRPPPPFTPEGMRYWGGFSARKQAREQGGGGPMAGEGQEDAPNQRRISSRVVGRDGNPLGSGLRSGAMAGEGMQEVGDRMMKRFGGSLGGGPPPQAPKLDASGSVTINLTGGLEKAPARVSMDGLFKDVKVNRGKSVSGADVPTI